MPHEDEDWDLNSPARVEDARRHMPFMGGNYPVLESPQAESAVESGNGPARVPTSADQPDGRVPYAWSQVSIKSTDPGVGNHPRVTFKTTLWFYPFGKYLKY